MPTIPKFIQKFLNKISRHTNSDQSRAILFQNIKLQFLDLNATLSKGFNFQCFNFEMEGREPLDAKLQILNFTKEGKQKFSNLEEPLLINFQPIYYFISSRYRI